MSGIEQSVCPNQSRRQGSNSLWFLIVIQMSMWLGTGITDPVLALFIREKGATMTEIGLLMMIGAFGWAVFEPIFGVTADRIGKKKLIALSSVAMSVTYLSYTVATGFWDFCFIMFALSSSMAASLIATRAMTAELLPDEGKGKIYGRCMATISMGTMLGPFLGGYLADTIGHHFPFYVSAGVGTLTLASALSMRYKERPSTQKQMPGILTRSHRSSLVTKTFVSILLLRLLYMFNWNFQRSVLPIFLFETETIRASETEIGTYLGIMRFSSATSQLFLGSLVDKAGTKKFIVSGLGLGGFSYVVLAHLTGIMPLFLLGVLQGIFFGATEMSMMIHLMTIVPQDSLSKAMGAYGFSEDIGGIIAAPFAATIYDRIGPKFSVLSLSIVLVSSAILAVFTVKTVKKARADKHRNI